MKKEIVEDIQELIAQHIVGTKFENKTYLVGGCVRDFIMDCDDIGDIDICVELPNGGIELGEYLKKQNHLSGSIVSYPNYGVSAFRLKEYPNIKLEAVQTRNEAYTDVNSRNPVVAYGSLQEDCLRRDLTINALYLNISSNEIIDPTGLGFNHIQNKILCTPSKPEIVYSDDPLRMMRAIRFRVRFEAFKFDENTYQAIKDNSQRISIISQERIQDELNKILLTNYCTYGIKLLKETKLLDYIIPEFIPTYDLKQGKAHHLDVFEHIMLSLENSTKSEFCNIKNEEDLLLLRMSLLLHDIGKTTTLTFDENGKPHFYGHDKESGKLAKVILTRLRYSNKFISDVCFFVENHMTLRFGVKVNELKDKSIRKLQYKCITQQCFNILLTLMDCDIHAHAVDYRDNSIVIKLRDRTESMLSDGTQMFNYVLPINGFDVMDVLSIKPSKQVSKCLESMLKVAFSDPKITREFLLKQIKNYKFN